QSENTAQPACLYSDQAAGSRGGESGCTNAAVRVECRGPGGGDDGVAERDGAKGDKRAAASGDCEERGVVSGGGRFRGGLRALQMLRVPPVQWLWRHASP